MSRKRNFYMLLIWIVFWVLYLQFGSMSFSKYVIIEKHERFLTLFTIPFFILVACFLSTYKNRFGKFFNRASIVVLLITSVYFTNVCNKFHSAEIRDCREIQEFLEEKKYTRVYADRETNSKLDFLFNYTNRAKLIDLNNLRRITQIKGNSYLITHGKGFFAIKPSIRRQLSDEVSLWKKGWKLEKVIGDNIVKGFKVNTPRIFHLP